MKNIKGCITMPNRVFNELLKERIEIFRNAFSIVSKNIFFDENGKKLIHPGEYGTYREDIVKDFLKCLIPGHLDISNGFLINQNDEISKQCDIVVYDSQITPNIQSVSRQRFFPVETVAAVGEVKSTLSETEFKSAINKLAKIKRLRENMGEVTVFRNRILDGNSNKFNAQKPTDQIFTFLVCKKLDFKTQNIANDIKNFYEDELPYRNRHNLILSLDDGLILYSASNNDDSTDTRSFMYPSTGQKDLKNRFLKPSDDELIHYKLFATYVAIGIAHTTIFFPEMANYISDEKGRIHGFNLCDES
jgi:hypothetical protein